jgi:hypothetical protein
MIFFKIFLSFSDMLSKAADRDHAFEVEQRKMEAESQKQKRDWEAQQRKSELEYQSQEREKDRLVRL